MPTEEELKAQKAETDKELATLVHSAVATHLKPLQAKLETALKAQMTESVTALGEAMKGQFAEFQKMLPSQGGGSNPAPGGGAGGGGNTPGNETHPVTKSPEFLALQTQVSTLLKENELSRKALVAAEEKSWNDRTMTAIQGWLTGKVKPDLLDVATDRCFKSVTKHDDGAPLFKIMKAPFAGMPEEEQRLPLEVGLDEWSRSKDGARFLPPPNPTGRRGAHAPGRGGVGTGPGEVGGPPQFTGEARTSREKNQRAMVREAAWAEQMPNLAKT